MGPRGTSPRRSVDLAMNGQAEWFIRQVVVSFMACPHPEPSMWVACR